MDTVKSKIRALLNIFGFSVHRKYAVVANREFLQRFSYMCRMYWQAKALEGSIVECGVGKGATFLSLVYLANEEGKKRQVLGLDSFEGFPEPTPKDASARNPKKGEWSGTSPEDIFRILNLAGIPRDFTEKNVRLVKGFLHDTLPSIEIGPIAVLHLDVDLYESYLEALTHLFPMVVSGGIIMFDEYNSERWPGATKAINEYFGIRAANIRKDIAAGRYYYIKE